MSTYRESADAHARAAEAALDASNRHEPTARQYMAALNLAKTHAIVSQAYSALEALPPTLNVYPFPQGISTRSVRLTPVASAEQEATR